MTQADVDAGSVANTAVATALTPQDEEVSGTDDVVIDENTNPKSSEADLRAVMEETGRTVAHRLEKYLSTLATIASAAPLLGLLGTVIGMIEIFGSQGSSTGTANPAQLAHGISVALYNTAFGLIVAIPALIFDTE